MGIIHLYTGTGGGKTTSVLGVALRAVGHSQKVVVIQFMKGRKDIGEYKVKRKLGKNYRIYQFGRKGFVNLKKPSSNDKKLAVKGLEFAKNVLKEKPNILILDEINIAVSAALLKVEDVIDFLKKVPTGMTVYLTGRYAPKKLFKYCNFITEIKDIKRAKVKARKGIEY